MEPPVLLALNTAAAASAEPQNRTTSSSGLEAAVGGPAPADRNTRAMASAWLAEKGWLLHIHHHQPITSYAKHALKMGVVVFTIQATL